LPITMPMNSGLICTDEIRARIRERACGSPIASAILARISVRARFACASASRMMSCVTPVILMSIWRAVMPSSVPAT
jgi:hypothetical protein